MGAFKGRMARDPGAIRKQVTSLLRNAMIPPSEPMQERQGAVPRGTYRGGHSVDLQNAGLREQLLSFTSCLPR